MKLIFITGKQGAGKSYVAKVFERSKQANRLKVDTVLESGAERWPRVEGQKPTAWNLWKEKSKSDLRPVLRDAIENTYGSLVGTRSNLIVEGAILCNSWFFEPFMEALVDTLKLDVSSPDFVYVDPSDALLFDYIVHRAKRRPNRRKELEPFPNVDAVGRYHEGFDKAIAGDSKWRSYPTKELAAEAVGRILDS